MARGDSLPAGTVTFLFTDIEGSTRLASELGDDYPGLLDDTRAILRQAVQRHDGHEFGTEGDASFVAFSRATNAVAAALDVQRALAAHAWQPAQRPQVRIGLHTGEADVRPDDYVGVAVHLAQRVCSAGHGGQVLLTSTAADLASAGLPPGVRLLDLGERRLKDLGRPQRLFQLCHADLRSEFPALRTLDVVPNNLPVQLTSFVGRADEVDELRSLLLSSRLVTLAGTGGAGKTRLALEVAASLVDEFPAGVWLASLAAVSDETMVPETVAAALGWREPTTTARDAPLADRVAEGLGGKRALLVLDNCEHVLAGCSAFADVLLRLCPRLVVCATSREPLGVPGERTWRVAPLSLPASGDDVAASEAVQLFADRALLQDRTFRLDEATGNAVAQICARLDGLPLAVELAAAWVRALSPPEIASRLDDRFRLLAGAQTLEAMLDWSYDLLTDAERLLFRRLWVFSGGFGLDAAEGVCSGPGIAPDEVLGLLSRLVDKSIVVKETRAGRAWYRLLETVREYSLRKMSGTAAPVTAADAAVHVFRNEGEYWTVGTSKLRYVKGLGYLHRLLGSPGVEVHALDLSGSALVVPGDAGEVLDAAARASYKQRLDDLGEDLEDARASNDIGRIERIEDEVDFLTRELAAAVGLGGRARRAVSDSERARMNVTKAIRGAIERIAAQDAVLGAHLDATIRTGTYCSYQPDPSSGVRWAL